MLGEVWEVCLGVGRGEGRCGGVGNVVGEVKRRVGKCVGRGEKNWGGGEGVEKVREICGEMCWGVGEVKVGVGRDLGGEGKCAERCGKMCWER